MSGTAVENYLKNLGRELRKHGVFGTRFMEETRGHLTDAIEAGRRGGLTQEAAEEAAIGSFGDAREVAAKYAAHKYRTLHWVLLIAAIGLGLAIAWVDSRPHWDDSGITAGALLLSAGVLGLIGPRRPWLWALAIGMWIPLYLIAGQVASHTITVGSASYLVILAFPMAGAYAGMGVRRLIALA
ncbi:MAG: permease prefix domain 1-containing protein [Acidobacteriaceae bacterium]